jgi:hypothetical protein
MLLAGLLIDAGTVTADFESLAAVALVGRHEFDAAVAMLVVVPVHERRFPMAGHLPTGERPAGVIRPVLRCLEQGF